MHDMLKTPYNGSQETDSKYKQTKVPGLIWKFRLIESQA